MYTVPYKIYSSSALYIIFMKTPPATKTNKTKPPNSPSR